jgi:hypothetical protein
MTDDSGGSSSCRLAGLASPSTAAPSERYHELSAADKRTGWICPIPSATEVNAASNRCLQQTSYISESRCDALILEGVLPTTPQKHVTKLEMFSPEPCISNTISTGGSLSVGDTKTECQENTQRGSEMWVGGENTREKNSG